VSRPRLRNPTASDRQARDKIKSRILDAAEPR